MDLSLILLYRVGIMLIFILIGIVCFKAKLVTDEGNRSLSNIVLYIVNPVLVFISFQQNYSPALLTGLGQTLVLSVLGYGVTMLGAYALIRGKSPDLGVERFAAVYSNCGFMGIPIANALFGARGVFFITAFNVSFNLLVWTHGIFTVTGDKSNMSLRKVVTNPTVLATAAGILCFLVNVKLPPLLTDAATDIGAVIAPLAMLVAGVTIAQTNLRRALKKPRVYLVVTLKLLVLPLVCAVIFALLPVALDETVMVTTVLAFACPSATIGIMLCVIFNKDADYAAELFAFSTLLSVLTLPAVIFIQSLL
ncbi:MAG: AEC family transporter [Oscillospiraceae bacterium]